MNPIGKRSVVSKILNIAIIATLAVLLARFCWLLIINNTMFSGLAPSFFVECLALLGLSTTCIVALVCILQHNRKQDQESMMKLAFYDQLTGIYNKTKFVSVASKNVLTTQGDFVIVSLDIKNFHSVNDLFGFQGGDMLLKFIAESATKAKVDPLELVCRNSGDEFYLLLRMSSFDRLNARLSALMTTIGQFAKQRGTQYNIVCRCGVSRVPRGFSGDLTRCCDKATIARGNNMKKHHHSITVFDDGIDRIEAARNEIENDMQRALENHEFKLFLQPQHDLKTGNLRGAEALVRWEHPIKGLVPPDVFVPLFEENGFILEVDQYILEQVCALLAKWRAEGKPLPIICVNQSRLHMYQNDYIPSLMNVVRQNRLTPDMIELELTETVAMDDLSGVRNIFGQLKELGFLLSMDDFGSGYSALNVLKELPLDVVKLDKEFFATSADSERGTIIIKNMISMAKELGITTISEGIETIEQVNFLKSIDCDIAQGYYYGKPMTVEEFEQKYHSSALSEAPLSLEAF